MNERLQRGLSKSLTSYEYFMKESSLCSAVILALTRTSWSPQSLSALGARVFDVKLTDHPFKIFGDTTFHQYICLCSPFLVLSNNSLRIIRSNNLLNWFFSFQKNCLYSPFGFLVLQVLLDEQIITLVLVALLHHSVCRYLFFCV